MRPKGSRRVGGRLSLAMHDVSQDLVMQFVALGFGLSLLSDSSTAIPYPGVAFRPLADEDDRVSYSAVWLPGNDNPALRRFLSLARFEVGGTAGDSGAAGFGLDLPCAPRALANSRSLAINFSNIGAINFEASMGLPDSRESISA